MVDRSHFNAEVCALLLPFVDQERVILEIVGHIVWGKPLSDQAGQEEAEAPFDCCVLAEKAARPVTEGSRAAVKRHR